MQQQPERALITGGSRGIGRAIALALAATGAAVAVNYAGNKTEAEKTVQACLAAGAADAFALQADIADETQAAALIAETAARLGGLDILVNNAGITRDGLLVRLSAAQFGEVLATNLQGAFHCMKAAARPMMKQRYGRILNIASVVGVRGNAGQANYAASKAGLIGLAKSAAKELAGRGITVNCLAPGFIETDMTGALGDAVREKILAEIPAGAFVTPADVAAAAVFLSSRSAGYITGQVLCVDGGMAM